MEREHGDLRAIRRASGERRESHARARSKQLYVNGVIAEDEVPADLSISVSLTTSWNNSNTTLNNGPETPEQQRTVNAINRARRQGGISPGGSVISPSTTPTSASAVSAFSPSPSPSLFRRRLSGHHSSASSSSLSSSSSNNSSASPLPASPGGSNGTTSDSDDLIARVRRHSSVWNHELTTKWEERFAGVIMDVLCCPEGPALIIARYTFEINNNSSSPLGGNISATVTTTSLLFDHEPMPRTRRRSLSPSLSGRLLRAASETAPPSVTEVTSPYPSDSPRVDDAPPRRDTLT